MALTERIVWSAPPDLPGVEILSAENNQRPWCVYHETYSICNIDSFVSQEQVRCTGEAEWAYRGKIHHSPARSLMLLEPGELHRNTKTPPTCNFSVVLIDPKEVNKVASEAGLRPNPHLKEAGTTDPRLYWPFFRFHAALPDETTALHRQSLLVECIGSLLGGHCEQTPRSTPDPGRRRLGWARDYLEEHFADKITLAQLAEISGLSRFHFQRAFSREFGLPPHRYQISVRIERVRQLLRSGWPADEAAGEVGFADQSHLIRHFKMAAGVTPGRYAATTHLDKAVWPSFPSSEQQ